MNAATKLKERTRRLIAPREKFAVLEVTPGRANALFLSVDEDRNLVFEKSLKDINLKKFLRSPLRRMSQKTWEGNYFFKSRRKIIVSADPSVATTMPIPLDLSRERGRWNDEIALEELENLIAQAMQKVFTQCRNESAKRLGVDDIHTILVGAKTGRFKIDGHSVMNPIGFVGKKISLLLELTFTRRETFEELKQFFSSPDEFFFVESPQAWLLSLSRARRLPLNVISGTSLFVFQKVSGDHPVLYREHIAWSFESIFRKIAEEFGVSGEMAQELYASYRRGELSESTARHFKKTIQPSLDTFFRELEKAKISGFVYLDTPYQMPFDLPYKHSGLTFEALPVGEILAELGLQADPETAGEGLIPAFRYLAPFLEAYFTKSTSEINQKLRRRLHWLAE